MDAPLAIAGVLLIICVPLQYIFIIAGWHSQHQASRSWHPLRLQLQCVPRKGSQQQVFLVPGATKFKIMEEKMKRTMCTAAIGARVLQLYAQVWTQTFLLSSKRPSRQPSSRFLVCLKTNHWSRSSLPLLLGHLVLIIHLLAFLASRQWIRRPDWSCLLDWMCPLT